VSSLPSSADLSGRFEGRLVVLEPLALEHAPGLIEAARDPGGDMFAWMPEDFSASPADLHQWLAASVQAAELGRDVPFAILEAATGEPLGSTRFMEIRLEHLRVEIGWTWLARRAWGTGVNVETKLLLLGHAFERVGVRRVEFKTDARNQRSRGALEALGAKFEGILRKHMVVRNQGERDSAYYSVIDDEWPGLKASLQERLARLTRPR
jgi:RimJ/RimL family protein N-acetyltransferase